MKKEISLVIFLFFLIFVGTVFLARSTEYDYLRLHIRANSNLSIDQNVKYEVKACVVEFLTPLFSTVKSKEDAVKIATKYTNQIKTKCDKVLKEKGFNYVSDVKINNEFFPTRTYQNTTLESGYYDAVIIELGEAQGDNWWCVAYPPLCFVGENGEGLQYRSKLIEMIKKFFGD